MSGKFRTMPAILQPDGQSRIRCDPAPLNAEKLGELAERALVEEARLTPKPGLVDTRGPGAHSDLNLDLLLRSARSLREYFEEIAHVSQGAFPRRELRQRLGAIGRSAERAMLTATGGVNTHRGAIWALGLLVSGAAMKLDAPADVAKRAACLARIPDRLASVSLNSNGAHAMKKYSVKGAVGEAQAGFPHVINAGLPCLLTRAAPSTRESRLNALLSIMARLNDTCLLHRGGIEALKAAKQGAAEILQAGGVATNEGWRRLERLDRDLLARNASPGGSADLLAATLFLDFLIVRPF